MTLVSTEKQRFPGLHTMACRRWAASDAAETPMAIATRAHRTHIRPHTRRASLARLITKSLGAKGRKRRERPSADSTEDLSAGERMSISDTARIDVACGGLGWLTNRNSRALAT